MFHNSTTIWHHPLPQVASFKEKRMVNFVGLGAVGGAMKTGWGVTKTAASWGWKATYPLRIPGILALGAMKTGAKSLGFVGKKGKWVGHFGKEVGLGIGKDAIGGSVLELGKAPIMFGYRNIVHNMRDITKGIFTTPGNILRAPGNLLSGASEGIADTRNSVSELVNEAKEFNPFRAIEVAREGIGGILKAPFIPFVDAFKIANKTRKVVQNALLTPFKAIWKPTKKILETPINVGKNIGLSIAEYPYRIYKSPTHIKKGLNRVANAHITASAAANSDVEIPAKEIKKAA